MTLVNNPFLAFGFAAISIVFAAWVGFRKGPWHFLAIVGASEGFCLLMAHLVRVYHL